MSKIVGGLLFQSSVPNSWLSEVVLGYQCLFTYIYLPSILDMKNSLKVLSLVISSTNNNHFVIIGGGDFKLGVKTE